MTDTIVIVYTWAHTYNLKNCIFKSKILYLNLKIKFKIILN